MQLNVQQPSVASVVQKISHELNAKAVLLLRESGEIIACSGWVEESILPNLAALLSAAASAGRSLGQLTGLEAPKHFHFDFEASQMYVSSINDGTWLAAFHEDVANPGLFRLQVRRYGQILGRLSPQEEVTPVGISVTPGATISPTLFANITDDEIDSLFKKPQLKGRS